MKKIKLPKLTPKLAYFCGVLAGDGNISFRDSRKEYVVRCRGNPKDEQDFYHKIISPIIKELFDIEVDLKKFDKGTTYGFNIYSKQLFLFLTETIGLPHGKKTNISVPQKILQNKTLFHNFIRGFADTDGCMTFKKRYTSIPYYPVIILSNQSKKLLQEISTELKSLCLNPVEIYDYKLIDTRAKRGFTIINRLELNGENKLSIWQENIGFSNPKHLAKIKKYKKR